MKSDIRWLFESDKFKVYSIYENVYLKDKLNCKFQDRYEGNDKFLAWIYSDPTSAIIMPNNDFVVIVGSGITIYDIQNDKLEDFYNEPDDIWWIDTVFQVGFFDDVNTEFRVVAFNEKDQIRVFKFDIKTKIVSDID